MSSLDASQQFNPIKTQIPLIKQLMATLTQATNSLSTLTQNYQTLAVKYNAHLSLMDDIPSTSQNEQQQSSIMMSSFGSQNQNNFDSVDAFSSPPPPSLPFFQMNTVFLPQSGQLSHFTILPSTNSNNPLTGTAGISESMIKQRNLEKLSEIHLSIQNSLPTALDIIKDSLASLHQFYSTTPIQLISMYPSYLSLIQQSMCIEEELKKFSIFFHTTNSFISRLNTNLLKHDAVIIIDSYHGNGNGGGIDDSKSIVVSKYNNNNNDGNPSNFSSQTLPFSSNNNGNNEDNEKMLNFTQFEELVNDIAKQMKNLDVSIGIFGNILMVINTNG